MLTPSRSPSQLQPGRTTGTGASGPLPGGVREYKHTLDALLEELRDGGMLEQEFFALLAERYGVTGETARAGYG